VANGVFIVSRSDYKARLLPFFEIQIISRFVRAITWRSGQEQNYGALVLRDDH